MFILITYKNFQIVATFSHQDFVQYTNEMNETIFHYIYKNQARKVVDVKPKRGDQARERFLILMGNKNCLECVDL